MTTAKLSVSATNIKNCDEIAHIMKDMYMNGNVSNNTTVIDGDIETGCTVLLCSRPVKENAHKLWKRLNVVYNLTCAHVEIEHSERGCVYDVYRESNCPETKA